MKNVIAVICAGVIGFSAVQAQQDVANPKSTIENFDVSSVGPVLNELGIAWQAQKSESGQTFIGANAGGVVIFLLAPTACRVNNVSDCVGLQMLALFEGNSNPQTVRAFNQRYAFANAGIDPSGEVYLRRYEISDYGMARGNLATSIQVFVQQAAMFASALDVAGRTVSLEGYADDLAAKEMNRQGLTDLTGVEIHAANPVDLHQRGLEQSAAIVRQFILDKSAPRNKIDNFTE